MATTTIRVDTDTHAALLELASETGQSLMETARAATEALQRQRFAQHVTDELNALRSDRDAWLDYIADAEQTSVRDGVA